MTFMDRATPTLTDQFLPPIVLGAGDLTTFAYRGGNRDALLDRIHAASARNLGDMAELAAIYDSAVAAQLLGHQAEGLRFQEQVLRQVQLFRVTGRATSDRPLRVLALMGPGDLMHNTPLDFLTNELDVRLDLLYLLPDRPLPGVIPDHDVAFFAISDADPRALARLRWLYAIWPRPALNDPRWLPTLRRDALARSLAHAPAIRSPTTVAASRQTIEAEDFADAFATEPHTYPLLIRPLGSHAGHGLRRVDSREELLGYVHASEAEDFYVTAFQPYCGGDGLHRKYRVAFVDRRPFLCHMAISGDWMVHYLNAGMSDSEEKRAEEALAMRTFDIAFARRHAAAFEALHTRLGFDFYSIDCAENQDGRLLIFEADTAAIIHLMDPPEVFPYKPPAMRKVCEALDALLRRKAGW